MTRSCCGTSAKPAVIGVTTVARPDDEGIRNDGGRNRPYINQDAPPRSLYQPQIDGMKSEVARLSSSISTAKADPTAATLSAVRSSVRDVGTAFNNLRQAVSGTC